MGTFNLKFDDKRWQTFNIADDIDVTAKDFKFVFTNKDYSQIQLGEIIFYKLAGAAHDVCPVGKKLDAAKDKCVCSVSAATCKGNKPDFDEKTCTCVCDKNSKKKTGISAFDDDTCSYRQLVR